MGSAIAGILTALGGFGSSVINNLERKNATDLTREYNSPAQQVQRLKKAGLNPYALAPQVAANNEGEFAAGTLDVGSDFASGIDAYSKATHTGLNRQMTSLNLEYTQQQVESLKLDNQFKAMTLNDRASFLQYKSKLAELDTRLKSGEITIQEYQQERVRLTTEWQQWNAGIVTPTYGDPHRNFEGEDLPDIANANAEYTRKNAIANIQTVEATVKKDIREYVMKTFKWKAKYTEQQALYMIDHAIRETIARKYEENTNLPWSSKDLMVHIFDGLLSSLKTVLPSSDSFGDALVDAFFLYLGIPRPNFDRKKSGSAVPNRTGRVPGEVPLFDYTPGVMKPAGTFGVYAP